MDCEGEEKAQRVSVQNALKVNLCVLLSCLSKLAFFKFPHLRVEVAVLVALVNLLYVAVLVDC